MITALQGVNGGIAYVAVSYLALDWPHVAAIKNAGGSFVLPNYKEIANAAAEVKSVPANNQLDLTNPARRYRHAYPISTFTYVIVPGNAAQGTLLRSFINFAINAGQSFAPSLDFVPIPRKVRAADEATLSKIH